MKFTSTSRPEIIVYYFVKKEFPDAINRHRIIDENGNIIEVDIFIPETNVAIEYDGEHWHKDKYDKDVLKTELLNSMGIPVVHIRETGLKDLPDFMGIQLWHRIKRSKKGMHTNEYLTAMINYLGTFCTDKEKKSRLTKFSLSYDEYKTYLPDINSLFYDEQINDSRKKPFSSYWISEYWNTEKNGRLKAENIPDDASIRVYLRCPCGADKSVNVFSVTHSSIERDISTLNILEECCSFIGKPDLCEEPCDYFYEKLKKAVDKRLSENFQVPDEKAHKQRGIFYRFHRYLAMNESLVTGYMKRLMNNEISYDQFEKLLMPNGRYLTSDKLRRLVVTKTESFALLKEFQARYCKSVFCNKIRDRVFRVETKENVYIDVRQCDKSDESRNALFDYVKWVFNDRTPLEREYYFTDLFWDVNCLDYSDTMINMLKDLLEEYPIDDLHKHLVDNIYGNS